jgi:hypothetical protein
LDLISPLPFAPHALFEHDNDDLVLASADGLATFSHGVVDVIYQGSINLGPIDAATRSPEGQYWCTHGERIISVDVANRTEPRDVTASFGGSITGRRQIVCTPDGEIWAEGCSTRRCLDGSFISVPPSPSGNAPTPDALDIYGNRWCLLDTPSGRQVMVLPANAPDTWQPAWLPTGSWEFLISDHVGYVWIAGPDGWRRFCPRHMEDGWQIVTGDLPSGEAHGEVTAVGISPDELVMAAYSTGEILELDTNADGDLLVRSLANLPNAATCLLTSHDGAIWAATADALYRREPAPTAWQHTWEKKRGRLPGGGNHDVFSVPCLGKLYVPGGWAGQWGLPPQLHVLDELFAYDPQTEYWDIVSRMMQPRRYCGVSAMEERVWVVGGETRIPGWTGEGQVLYTVDIYDPQSDTWSPAPSLNVARTDPFVLSCNGRIWAIGGAAHNAGPKLDSVESIGPGEDTWRFEASLPEPTRQGHACELDGVIYCASIDGMYAYDVTGGRWDVDFPQPGEIGQGPLIAAYRGEIWLMGGYQDQRSRCFDPVTRTWRDGPDLPTSQAWAAATVLEGELVIVGGAHWSEGHDTVVFDDRTYALREGANSTQ